MNTRLDQLHITEENWRQGGFGYDTPKKCLAAHLNTAWWGTARQPESFSENHDMDADYRALCDIICEQYPDRVPLGHPVSRFNDYPDTTVEDVNRILEKAYVRRLENDL